MALGVIGHLDPDVGQVTGLSYTPSQSGDRSVLVNICRVYSDVFDCHEEVGGPRGSICCKVVPVDQDRVLKIGRGFEYGHIVRITNNNGVQAHVQFTRQYVCAPRHKDLGGSCSHFILVSITTTTIGVDGILQRGRVVGLAIPSSFIRLDISIDWVIDVIAEKGSLSLAIPGMILVI